MNICNLHALLYHDKLYVQYSNHSVDGSNLYVHCTGHGCRPEGSSDGVCNRRFLRICNTDWYASKHNGRRSGRIYIYGLCKSWIPVDYHCYSREHDYLTNCISFFPVRKKIVFIGNDLNETYTLLYKSCIYKF